MLPLEEQYIKEALYRQNKKRSYYVANKMNYNPSWEDRQRYLYFTFQVDYLHNQMLGEDMTPVFITLTLPSEYHFSGKLKDVEYGKKTIKEGYVKLNSMFRNLYKNFKYNRKYLSLKYVKVIEPHKSFVPHLHALVYVPTFALDAFKSYFEKSIIKNNKLKQYDLKVLEKEKWASVYLLKYVNKALSGDLAIKGWCLVNNIRQYSVSRAKGSLTKDMFKIINKFIRYNKNDSRDFFSQLLDKVKISVTYVKRDFTRVKKTLGNPDATNELKLIYNVLERYTLQSDIYIPPVPPVRYNAFGVPYWAYKKDDWGFYDITFYYNYYRLDYAVFKSDDELLYYFERKEPRLSDREELQFFYEYDNVIEQIEENNNLLCL